MWYIILVTDIFVNKGGNVNEQHYFATDEKRDGNY